jgi:hypothetical protein
VERRDVHIIFAIVTLIKDKVLSVLIPGDAEGLVEKSIMYSHQTGLGTCVIHVLSHHSSRTNGTNSVAWLNFVNARSMCISSSLFHFNGDRHPSKVTLETLRKIPNLQTLKADIVCSVYADDNITILSEKIDRPVFHTVDCGTIQFLDKNGKVNVQCAKIKKI